MKFKKIMSLLLVLTLIGSLLTTVTLLNPTAEDTEATTPAETTNYDTYVLHAKGAANATSRGIYIPVVRGTDVTAGETYTVIVTVQGLTMTDYSYVFIKSGDSGVNAVASCQGKGEKFSTYSGATQWVADITPTTAATLFLGIYLNSTYLPNADFYVGGVQVIDKNGNNIALAFTPESAIYAMASPTGGVQYGTDESKFYELRTMIDIDDVEDKTLKKTLFDNFYTGDSMINFKKGSVASAQLINIYKKIPASKLKANTTYTFSVRYDNPQEFCNDSRYFVVREPRGGTRTNLNSAGTVKKISGYADCYEFTAEYTTGDTAKDLYVGFHMNGSSWGMADFYIADMTFVEKGKVKNLLTPLACMDYYCATAGSNTSYINPYTSTSPTDANVYTFVAITKHIMDKDKYFEPEDMEAAKYLLHAKGLAAPASVRGILVQVPASRLTEGESYTVNVTLFGKALNSSYCALTVQSGESSNGLIAHTAASTAAAKGTTTTTYSGATKWTVNITPDASKNIYIGTYMNSGNLTNADFYLGDIEVIDKNGNNIAPTYSPSSSLFAFASWGGGVQTTTDTSEAGFFETREFIRLDRVSSDETLKQKLFDSYYKGDSMLNLEGTNTNHIIYKMIPASKLKGNTKYKISVKYTGVGALSDNNYIIVRETATTTALLTSKNYINHGNYYEAVDYYTTPETPSTLYIGFYRSSTGWSGAQLNIGDMQFVDAQGNNYMTPMSNTADLYSGYKDGAINDYTSANTVVKARKQILDTEMFSDPVSTDRKMINVSGLNGGNNAKFYVKVPHLLAGTYRATYKIKGIDLVDGRYFDVRTNTPMATNSSTIVAGPTISSSVVACSSIDEVTYEFTTTDFSDAYLGFTIPMKHVTAMNFYIEKLELVRIVDGVASENLIDDNLNITKFSRHNANNGESEAWTTLTVGTNGSVSYNTVFKLSVMDYDESILYPSQIVNLKGGEEQSQNYQYAKKASNLKAGTYRVTLIEQGANIKTSTNQRFWVDLNGSQIVNTYWESGREYVETFGTSSYKFQYDVTVEEDGASVMGGFTIGYTYMPKFNAYITEISLVKIDEQGNAISENLFSDLNVRDWCGEAGTLLGIEKYGSTSVRLKNIDLGVADANGNGKTDIADIRILSKMQDAGMILTEGVNDVIFVRNAVLNAAS